MHPRRAFLISIACGIAGACLAPAAAQSVVRIRGTGVTLTAPPGFKPSRTVPGLEDPETGSTITVAEYGPDRRDELAQVFASPKTASTRYASENTRITRVEPLAVDAGRGTLAIGGQVVKGQEFTKYIAVLAGERTKSALITFNVAPGSTLRRGDVDAVLKSVTLERLPTLEEKLATLAFTFKAEPPFRVSDVTGNTVLLTSFDGADASGNKPMVMIAKTATSAAPAEAAKEAERMLRAMSGFGEAQITERAQTQFAGGAGVVLTAAAGDRTLVQYLRVLPGGSVVRLVARGASAALEETLPAVKAIAESVEVAN